MGIQVLYDLVLDHFVLVLNILQLLKRALLQEGT